MFLVEDQVFKVNLRTGVATHLHIINLFIDWASASQFGFKQQSSWLLRDAAVSAAKHSLPCKLSERPKRASFVKPTLVTTHGSHWTRSSENRATFFWLVAKSIAGNFCCFVSWHVRILWVDWFLWRKLIKPLDWCDRTCNVRAITWWNLRAKSHPETLSATSSGA